MSKTPPDTPGAGPVDTGLAGSVFQHEVRRDGRVIATLHAHETATGVTVESEVFPVAQAAGEPGVTRPFAFTSLDHARRFADDALVAFEYLNCTVS